MGGGTRGGGRHCSLLGQSFGGSLCHRAQPSGCHSLSNKQSRSAWLPLRPRRSCPSPPRAGLSLSGPRWLALAPSEPRSPPLWPCSPALPLSHTPSHSQSLSASFSQVLLFLAHACALPHRLIFSLPSPLPPGFWSLSSALSGAGNPPPLPNLPALRNPA